MIVDCDSCEVRGNACGECVIGVLLGVPGVPQRPSAPDEPAPGGPPGASTVQLDAPERRALDVLADQGLVPRLRLVAAVPRRAAAPGDAAHHERDAV
ncbi:hypothetical protein [Pseudonocardia sp.]|uniref:hypothetical protein n=1 Tax=Pseudonocardia sp. TaxID=60912 RepID=UPI0026083B60|nr:hypothetical protein [Pseudonocardia sp.]